MLDENHAEDNLLLWFAFRRGMLVLRSQARDGFFSTGLTWTSSAIGVKWANGEESVGWDSAYPVGWSVLLGGVEDATGW